MTKQINLSKDDKINIYGDSELIIKQLKGTYKPNKMISFYNTIQNIIKTLPNKKKYIVQSCL